MDRPRTIEQSFAGASHNLILDPALSNALKAFARQENVTLFVVLLASFQALLHRYSGQADIRVGVPMANRGRVEIERLIGFFVNTQVLKADIDGQQSFCRSAASGQTDRARSAGPSGLAVRATGRSTGNRAAASATARCSR